MREMIKRVRKEKGGFTLAELLVVVAIILVLVAIAIPVFIGATDRADAAVAAANARSVKAEATTTYLLTTGTDAERAAAAAGTYYLDENDNIVRGEAGNAEYVYTVTVDSGTGDITVTQTNPTP